MLLHKFIIPFFLLFSTVILSQERIKHKVVQGESVYSIAKKYNVKPSDIFELNPKSKKTLSLNTVLTVPNNNYKAEEKSHGDAVVIHEVLPKETLYGISKKYKVTIDQIKAANPIIEVEGLKLGTKITIPGASDVAEVVTSPIKIEPVKEAKPVVKADVKPKAEPVSTFDNQNEGEEIIHQVLPKETKYGISKRYKISIEELEKLNPGIVNGLSVGYQLVIRKGNKQEIVENQIAQNQTKVQNQTKNQNQVKNQNQTTVSPQIEEEEEEEEEVFKSSSQFKVVEIKESGETITLVPTEPLSLENMSKADFLIAKASENLGARYRSGATGNGGFDCSGLMFATYKNIEMTLPRSSHEMAAGAGSRIDRSQAQKGDLIFFATMGKGRVSHVGMVTEVSEEGEIKFIHSSTSAGVIISSVNEPYYAKRFVQVNRVLVN
ncbi:peptidoglycan endopeptidase [Flavobacterium sp.]|uniref:peptidoglycan endopeptidase n=1 Tax=Flavobacterium sp. TaxID=239 RepID=UPI002625A66F|nr:peptidoglycan endopeptidase [Flavobacterium sp.]